MSIPPTFVVFDLLRLDGTDVSERPYSERREFLESLDLNSSWWRTCDTFMDGDALFKACAEWGSRVSSRRSASAATAPEAAVGSR